METAELLAIPDGIHFSLANGFRSLCEESDVINVINSTKNKCVSSSNGNVVSEVMEFF